MAIIICNIRVMINPMIYMMIRNILMILRMPTKMVSGLCGRMATRVFCVLWMFFHVLLCFQAGGAWGGDEIYFDDSQLIN